jgi:hypothetical protein
VQHISQFSKNAYWCKACCKEFHKEYSTSENGKAVRRAYQFRTKYGMASNDYDIMYTNQQGCCAICKHYYSVLCVDHRHSTGKVRALLCDQCNRGIGMLKESVVIMSDAINYIQTYNV